MKIPFLFIGSAIALSAHASFVIDDFSVSQAQLVRTSAGNAFNSLSTGGADREQSLSVSAYTDSENLARATSRITQGVWTFSSDDFVTASGTMTYNFDAPKSFVGNGTFKIDFLRLDQEVEISGSFIGAGPGFKLRVGSIVVAPSATPFSVLLTPNNTFGAFNPASVKSAQISLSGPQSLDFRISSIEAVPEPVSMMVLGAGALVLARRRRKA